jgi:hypothetical protein
MKIVTKVPLTFMSTEFCCNNVCCFLSYWRKIHMHGMIVMGYIQDAKALCYKMSKVTLSK